ncbi:hypothetical protein [Natronococcus sp.]|uniref:hypothetical protein n=1 Tax=Natronococcus sp. TaxID=35747 RepID=UPI003A4DF7E0
MTETGEATTDRERTAKALAVGLACGVVIAVAFVAVFDDLLLGASSGLTFGVVIAALLADRWETVPDSSS